MLEIAGLYKPKRVQLVTMGCSKNRVDSEKLLSRLSDSLHAGQVCMRWIKDQLEVRLVHCFYRRDYFTRLI